MSEFGRTIDLEEDVCDRLEQTTGASYGVVEQVVFDTLKRHCEVMSPQEFTGKDALDRDGVVFYDLKNAKALYAKLWDERSVVMKDLELNKFEDSREFPVEVSG